MINQPFNTIGKDIPLKVPDTVPGEPPHDRERRKRNEGVIRQGIIDRLQRHDMPFIWQEDNVPKILPN
jgi:hypothetical protein